MTEEYKGFATDFINGLLSGNVRNLEIYHQRHMAGDKTALMSVLIACAALQAVIPDWAVDELLTLDERINSGEVDDLNKFFGFKVKKPTIKKLKIKKASYSAVLMNLINHRLLGGTFSTRGDVDNGLRVISDITKTPARVVEEIYAENKDMLLTLPNNSSKDENHGVMNMTIPLKEFRRRGRPTFED